MSRLKYEPCPSCRRRGMDSRGDNLVCYPDGSAHCYSCSYHLRAPFLGPQKKVEKPYGSKVLPADFSREVEPAGWRWLSQYGIPFSYWIDKGVGYSQAEGRLVFPIPSSTPHFSIGRLIEKIEGKDHAKWRSWGKGTQDAYPVGNGGGHIVLVEDYISANKLAFCNPDLTALPLFGAAVLPVHIKWLQNAPECPTTLWLDWDKGEVAPRMAMRLQTLLGRDINIVRTRKDPKLLSKKDLYEALFQDN